MEAKKKAVDKLLTLAKKENINVTANEQSAKIAAFGFITATANDDGSFNFEKALEEMEKKYGLAEAKKAVKHEEEEEIEQPPPKGKGRSKATKKVKEEEPVAEPKKRGRAKNVKKDEEEEEEEEEKAKPKKARKKATPKEEETAENGTPSKEKKERHARNVVNPANQGICDVFRQLASLAFKQGDTFRGGRIQKAGTALCGFEDTITCGKQATVLKGVGKGSAGWIDEFLTTGKIQELEDAKANMQDNENL